MTYEQFQGGAQYRLVREIETLVRKHVVSLRRGRLVVGDIKRLRRAISALQLDKVGRESKIVAARFVEYADAFVRVRYSSASKAHRHRLRVRAERLDVYASVSIPIQSERAIAEFSGPRSVRALTELLRFIACFHRLLGEFELCTDRFLEARLRDQDVRELGVGLSRRGTRAACPRSSSTHPFFVASRHCV